MAQAGPVVPVRADALAVRSDPRTGGGWTRVDESTAYVTLGIDETTSPDEARVIYRRRLRLLHPDLHGTHDPQLQLEAERATRQLSSAWQTLQESWSAEAERPVSSMAGAGRAPRPPGPGGAERPPPPRPTPPGTDECSECGGAPIRRARLRTGRRGQVIVEDQRLCRRCGLNAFRDAQATTLTVGWLSLTGPIRAPRAVAGNLRAWWRFRKLGDVLPPLRPVVTTVVAPAEMVRPVLRRPVPALLATALAAIVVALVAWGGVALASSGGHHDSGPSLSGTHPTTSPTKPHAATTTTAPPDAVASIDPGTLPGCSSSCRLARSLRVTVAGQPADLLLVSTADGRPVHALRFYLLRDSDRSVLWSGPQQPVKAYISKRLGVYRGSALRQDATGHVFVDLLTGADSSFIAVLDLGNGTNVRDFGSLELNAFGQYRFAANTPGADTVDIDGARIFDIALPRTGTGQPYYDLYRWNGTDYVPRGCARTLVDGGLGELRAAGTCT
jgi:hypothetical protein